ncbi:MAG: hypothetical protein GX192_00960 [Clostridiales bacterium]|nr:hypothetical protein [Clostridiales bacterium]
MKAEETILRLKEAFSDIGDDLKSPSPLRVFTPFLEPKRFEEVLIYAKDKLDYYRGLHIVGTDEGENLGFTYLVSNADGVILAIREIVPKSNPHIRSMSDIYPAMLMHERELVDLFGAEIEGLPEGPSYPLPDGWPKGQYPMRKEWNPKYFNKMTMTYEPPEEKATDTATAANDNKDNAAKTAADEKSTAGGGASK